MQYCWCNNASKNIPCPDVPIFPSNEESELLIDPYSEFELVLSPEALELFSRDRKKKFKSDKESCEATIEKEDEGMEGLLDYNIEKAMNEKKAKLLYGSCYDQITIEEKKLDDLFSSEVSKLSSSKGKAIPFYPIVSLYESSSLF